MQIMVKPRKASMLSTRPVVGCSWRLVAWTVTAVSVAAIVICQSNIPLWRETHPQMHRRVSPPGPPCFHPRGDIGTRRFQQSKVGSGECVGLFEGSHGDVLGGPIADASELAEVSLRFGRCARSERFCGRSNGVHT